METLAEPPTESSASPAPRWATLHRYANWRSKGSPIADVDAKTLAASFTSSGQPFGVCFHLAPPPANSGFEYDWAGFAPPEDELSQDPDIVAAHGDCVLFEVVAPNRRDDSFTCTNYFLYEAARPPSLSLLPACYFATLYERHRLRHQHDDDEYGYGYREEEADDDDDGDKSDDDAQGWRPVTTSSARVFLKENTGVLRRGDGDGEVVVAELDMPRWQDRRDAAELCVLRVGDGGEWELKRVPIVFDGDNSGEEERDGLQRWWETDAVVPVAGRFLCFVDYFRGFLLCDMAVADSNNLTLRYVPLPVVVPRGNPDTEDYGRPKMEHSRTLADAGDGTVRFVGVEPRCCCGKPGRSTCPRSSSAFIVTTWTLNLGNNGELSPVTWVKNGVLDCEEIWAQPAYGSLPRTALRYPVVSSDDPDTVCFIVYEGRKDWMLEIDTRSKVLRSVVLHTGSGQPYWRVPVKLFHRCCGEAMKN